jgi:tRNA (mo5U34)-methyltransferase
MKLPTLGGGQSQSQSGPSIYPPIDPADIRTEAEKLRWYHCLRLTPGYTTPGISGFSLELRGWEKAYQFPSKGDLQGKSLLDIGTMNGIFAFEAERRGASRVVATDRDPAGFPDAPEAFHLAGRALGSRVVEYRGLSIYDLDPKDIGEFDYVLLYGVIYHLKFPLLGLYKCAAVCKEQFIIETHVTLNDDLKRPMMLFYPGTELNDEPTNWWGPNPRCVDALIEHLGFEIIGRATAEQNVTGFQQARYTVRGRRVRPTPDPWEM